MSEIKLNLARKWRSKTFDEIIGQELSIRMLKNGLFLQQYFPVYLFSGQRGCGKTTTARVFAAALNCQELPTFQNNPQNTIVPCLACKSCMAMQSGKHPDFIEIDAASHTGVDNVRSIIDSATLMPLMGRKKVYLIDEAHMLSKAAFNAFLKILEEPPASVIFILATTDPQKIIETVRSRCFQLIFNPVQMDTLKKRLQAVCEAESIAYSDEGLELIINQTEGSVRDALNVLEQVRFSSKEISQEAVLDVLGYVDDATLITLLDHLLYKSPASLLKFLAKHGIQRYSMPMVWNRFMAFVRAALWLKHGVTPSDFTPYHQTLIQMIRKCSVQQLQEILATLHENQELFGKTTSKYDLFEMVLLSICQKNGSDSEGSTSPSSAQAPSESPPVDDQEDLDEEDEDEEEEEESIENKTAQESTWDQFVKALAPLNDPLINSVFTQGVVQEITDESVSVQFSKQFVFFQDLLAQTKDEWHPIFVNFFGNVTLKPLFTGAAAERKIKPTSVVNVPKPAAPVVKKDSTHNGFAARKSYSRKNMTPHLFADEHKIDISDQDRWKKTHMLLRSIPGSITEISSEVRV